MLKIGAPGEVRAFVRFWLPVAAAGAGMTAALFGLGLVPDSPRALLVLFGLAAAGAYVARDGRAPYAGTPAPLALVAPMAAAFVAGLPGALMVAAPVGVASVHGRDGRRWRLRLNRLATPAVTAVVFGAVCEAFERTTSVQPSDWPGGLLPGLVGATLSLAATASLGRVASGQLRPAEVRQLARGAASDAPYWLALGLAAAAMGAVYHSMGLTAMAVFAVPLGIAWISSIQRGRSVRGSRHALRSARTRLAAAGEEARERERLLQRLVSAVDERCHGDPTRSARVADLAVAILRQMGIESGAEIESDLRQAALVHDLGLLFIPDEVLGKAAPLSPAERNLITAHPETAFWALAGHGLPDNALQIVRAHHERFDGTGYPNRLRSLSIPLGARILAVADAFEAMTSRRVYSDALPVEAAMQELRRGRGTQFDPQCADACIEVVSRRGRAKAGRPCGTAA